MGESYQLPVARMLMINLGNRETKGVKMQLQDRQKGVWAAGPVDTPARSVVVALLPILPDKGFWGWGGIAIMEVDAPGSEVFNFLDSRHQPEAESGVEVAW